MQVLASYRFEAETTSIADRDDRMKTIMGVADAWLRDKGVADLSVSAGAFTSKTAAGDGRFARTQLRVGDDHFSELLLTEYTRTGLTFTTRIAQIAYRERVIVYVSLTAASSSTVVSPIFSDPKCPAVVRSILSLCQDWKLDGTEVPGGKPLLLSGAKGAQQLATEIGSSTRALPLIVVSQNEGQATWPQIADGIAYDLAGLATVLQIDEEASWTLTDLIGKRNSCYLGAVRLYWPSRSVVGGTEPRYLGTVWTASTLLSSDVAGDGERKFRQALRRTVMGTAALAISPPAELREIQSADARRRLEEIRARSSAASEELEIAKLYVAENEQLRSDLEAAKTQLRELLARAQAAEYALDQQKPSSLDESPYATEEPEDASPQPDEVRFYKKTHSKSAYDVLVQVKDCGHNKWQGAAKADKAKKGIEKLEERSDWKSVQHCGSCTGGGMWKVRW
ncbi:MAG: hypothetical protein K2Y26_07450 [Gemmatimonadaceae bacterium]|nr:hypothetical protein [Gemmatimonadaceae bacterium]